jgi:propanol-preferring alcohol dehydrogenase
MKALVLKRVDNLERNPLPLELVELPQPIPGPGQLLLRVSACGVCHTELDEIEGSFRAVEQMLPASGKERE